MSMTSYTNYSPMQDNTSTSYYSQLTYGDLATNISVLWRQVNILQEEVSILKQRLALFEDANSTSTSTANTEDFFKYLNFLYSLNTDIFGRYLEGTRWDCISSDIDNSKESKEYKTYKYVDIDTYNIYTLNYLIDKKQDKSAYMDSLIKLLKGIINKEDKCGVYTKGDNNHYGLVFYLNNLYLGVSKNKNIPTVFSSNMSDMGIDLDECKDLLNKIFNSNSQR